MHNLTPQIVLNHLAAGRYAGNFPGAVLFVDISGFTSLTAALTAHGNEGAEVLAEILLAVLDPMIEQVFARGGFVAGYAGDAFKAIFPGDDAAQALAAAQAIHRHMAVHPSRQTPFGLFKFAVRAGIAAGDIRWQIWAGDDSSAARSHAYTFSGAAIDQAVQGGDHVAAGELVITDAVYAQLEALATAPTTVRLSGAADGYRRVISIPDPATPHIDLASSVPNSGELLGLAARFHPMALLNARARGEFRPVVSVFCNVQTLDADSADFMSLFFRLLNQYGGYLCRVGRIGGWDSGGTFLLFWGAPTAHENDVERALSFLLDLRAQSDVPLRAGVTSGMAYAGFVGSARSEEYTCYGLQVNLAARQMSAARWNELWLDPATARRAEAFDVAPAGRFLFKGFAGELPVFALLGRSGRTHSTYQRALVGRDAEMAQLWQVVQPIFEGRFGGVAVVYGEAGIGKSRLLYDLRRRIETAPAAGVPRAGVPRAGVRWFHCPADEILRRPLNPFRHTLRAYFDQQFGATDEANRARFDERLDALLAQTDAALRDEVQRTRSFLAALIDLYTPNSLYDQVDPRLRFENTLAALSAFLRAESRRNPVVIEIEDLHWLDDESRLCLQRLLQEAGNDPIAILISGRALPAADFLAEGITPRLIALAPLTEDALAQIAHNLLGETATPELVARLAAQSEGNPFFAEQILLYLREENLLARTAQGLAPIDDLTLLPDDVHSLLVARLDRLALRVREVVQTAAVLGREFAVEILVQMLREQDEIGESLRIAEAESIWTALGELRYLFRHALLREAAYEMQLRARLRRLHRLAAEAIEQVHAADLAAHYADLAYHYRRAAIPAQERLYAGLAGRRAAAHFVNAEAVAHLSRALELTPSSAHDERFDLLVERVGVYERQGERTAQRDDLDALAELAAVSANPMHSAEVALLNAEYFEAMSDFRVAQTAAERALDISTTLKDVRLAARAQQHLGRVLWRQGEYAASEMQSLASLHSAQQGGLRELEADALIVLGIARWFVGDYVQAEDYLQRSLPIYSELGKPVAQASAWQNLGLVAQNRADHSRALSHLTHALDTYREAGARQNQAITLSNLAFSYQRLGEYDQALACLQQALHIFTELNERFGQMIVTGSLGGLHFTLGRRADAKAAYGRALDLCQQIGSGGYDSSIIAMLAEIDFEDGNAEPAYSRLQDALHLAQSVGHRDNEAKILAKVGRVALALGRFDDAVAAYDAARIIRNDLGQHVLRIEALAGLADVALTQGDVARAVAFVAEIRTFLQQNSLDGAQSPFDVYLTCFRVLEAYRDPASRELLAEGYRLLQTHAAHIGDDAMRRSFLAEVTTHRTLAEAFTNAGLR